jgi:sugar lactone lactonase YvrE
LLSKIIISSWDENPKYRPDFGVLARQLESDIIQLQVSFPAVFVPANGMNKANNLLVPQGSPGHTKAESEAVAKGKLSNWTPSVVQHILMVSGTGLDAKPKTVEQKKPINFLTSYSKKKMLLVIGCAIGLIVLVLIIVLMAIYLNPQQKKSAEFENTTATSTTTTKTLADIPVGPTSSLPFVGALVSTTDAITSAAVQAVSSTTKSTTTYTPRSEATIVSTLAGSGAQGFSEGYGVNASFNFPLGITFRASDNMIFVANLISGRIMSINSSGYVQNLVKGVHPSVDGYIPDARFSAPYGIEVDGNGNLIVAERTNLLRSISKDYVSTIAGSYFSGLKSAEDGLGSAASFEFLSYVAFDNDGNIYATEESGRIRKIDNNGDVTTIAGSSGEGNLDGPGISAQFRNPKGIVFDHSASLFYISDYDNHVIKSMDLAGNVAFVAGSTGRVSDFVDGRATAARFRQPNGLALDHDGNLIIVDMGNNAIRRLNMTSMEVTTIAGNGTAGSRNGRGKESTFRLPRDVAIDQDGAILVTDGDNNLIRKISFARV